MQARTTKLTGFVKLGNNGIWLPVSEQQLNELQLNEHDLLLKNFVVSVTDGRVLIQEIDDK